MLPKSLDTIRIDINSGQVRKSVSINQNDTSQRTLNFFLVDGGKPVDISDLLFAEILIQKADGYEVDNGCVIDGNSIQYTLRSNDIAALGKNIGQLMLTFESGQVLTTPTFEIVVYAKVLNQQVQASTNEYNALAQQLVLVQDWASQIAIDKSEADISAQSAAVSASEAATYLDTVSEYESQAGSHATSASQYANAASSEAIAASEYAHSTSVLESEIASELLVIDDYKTSTSEYISSTSEYADSLSEYMLSTSELMSEADAYASSANSSAIVANTAQNGAQHFYNETLAISQTLANAIIARGTIAFADLPDVTSSAIKNGFMYNISDNFTTTVDFVEGAGLSVPMGANVYKVTINNVPKWDLLAGTTAAVFVGTEAQIAQADAQGLISENTMIISLDGEAPYELTSSMILHGNDSVENVLDGLSDDVEDINTALSEVVTCEHHSISSGFVTGFSGSIEINDFKALKICFIEVSLTLSKSTAQNSWSDVVSSDYIPISGQMGQFVITNVSTGTSGIVQIYSNNDIGTLRVEIAGSSGNNLRAVICGYYG